MRTKNPSSVGPFADWEAEDALHTLTRAEQHRANPKMMERVTKLAAEKKQHLGKIARMKPRTSVKPSTKRR